MSRLLIAVLALCFVASCLAESTPVPDDAGPAADSGFMAVADTGPPAPDANVITDTGVVIRLDTGLAPDAEVVADVGFAGDVGFAPDATVGVPQPRYVFVGDDGVWASSPDGSAWSQNTPNANYESLFRDIVYADGTFFAVGGANNVGFVLVSADGVTWNERGRPPRSWVGAAGWIGGLDALVVAGGVGLRARSLNAATSFIDDAGYAEVQFRDAASGNGRVVAVGDTFGGSGSVGSTSMTQDGRQWTPLNNGGDLLIAVAFGNGWFVATGRNGRVERSTDGETWTNVTVAGSPTLSTVAFGDGKFLAGAGGDVYESTDNGATWTMVSTGPQRMVYGDGRWVGVTFDGRSVVSTNGRSWTASGGTGLPSRAAAFGWVQP